MDKEKQTTEHPNDGGVDAGLAHQLHSMIENLQIPSQTVVDNVCIDHFGSADPAEIVDYIMTGKTKSPVKKSSEIIW